MTKHSNSGSLAVRVINFLVDCSLPCLKGSTLSELIVNLETEIVGASLGSELLGTEILVSFNSPVLVNLVFNFELLTPVLAKMSCCLNLGSFTKFVDNSGSQLYREPSEALGTLRCIVSNFKSMSSVQVIDFNGATSAYEMFLEVSSEESNLSSFWGESKLCPQSLSCLDIRLNIPAEVVLVVMGKIDTFL